MPRSQRLSPGGLWRTSDIEAQKAAIKKELDEVGKVLNLPKRLSRALSRIRELENDTSRLGTLRRFIYVISALVHHLSHGGLISQQVQNLAHLGTAILKIQGIAPVTSKLGFLYGDLHLVLSQIYRKSGDQWHAGWQQLTSFYLSQRAPSGGKGFQSFVIGNLAIRLGQGRFALKEFENAKGYGVSQEHLGRVQLEHAKSLRLCGRVREAESIFEDLSSINQFSEGEKKELAWELMCRKVAKSGDITPLVMAIRKGKSHHKPIYIVEAFIWSRAVQTRQWIQRFPRMRNMARHKGITRKSLGFVYDCATAIDQCYDYEIPYDLRLDRLGRVLGRSSLLPTIDLELLLWGAAARWLARSRTFRFTALVLGKYHALCLQLSNGRFRDTLGILGDFEGYLDLLEDFTPTPEKQSA